MRDTGGVFPWGGIRVRAIRLEDYVIADGKADDAFINITVKMAGGRSAEFKREFFTALFEQVKAHFADLYARRYLALSLYVEETDESRQFQAQQYPSAIQKGALMPLSDSLIADMAARLDAAERNREQIGHFSLEQPGMTIEDGYGIQRAWVAKKIAGGRRLIGHKIGLTSRAMQRSSNIDEPDYGALLDDMLFANNSDIPIRALHRTARGSRTGLRPEAPPCRSRLHDRGCLCCYRLYRPRRRDYRRPNPPHRSRRPA